MLNIKRRFLVGSSGLVWNLSMKLGMEAYVEEVTVGVGFGAMSMDRLSSACMDRVRRESQWQNLEGIAVFKGLVNKEELGRKQRIDQRSNRKTSTVVSEAKERGLEGEWLTVLTVAKGSG